MMRLCVVFFASMFVHGFCLPCCPFVEKLLIFFDVAPSQIAVGEWIFIIAFVVCCLERLFGPPIISKFSDNRERFFFLKKAGSWPFRNSWNIGSAPVGNLRTHRNFVKKTKDDEVRVLVAWEGWVDGRDAPSAQDYLVSRRNAFFFCVESQSFMTFDFPDCPAITEMESDHDQEGTVGPTLLVSDTNDGEPNASVVWIPLELKLNLL
ncbi:hypothetical protein ACFE04_018299 [Oxalis oulophora]